MLVFIDESGDPGLKIGKGSSKYFTVALVVFQENAEAEACDQRIELLKREIGWKRHSEFHFQRNSNRVREVFLNAVSPYSFFIMELLSIRIQKNYGAMDLKIKNLFISMHVD